ncbi:hypothetical protein H1R20_g6675, partial [Candolleomyces eurysporus]
MDFEDPSIPQTLEKIRNLSDDDTQRYYHNLIPIEHAPSPQFWQTLGDDDSILARRLILLACVASKFTLIPYEFQLTASLATIKGQDSLVDVGTGYGKTWCMILPALYRPSRISLVVSPLKRLQVVQVGTFEKYGIRAVAINEDTPGDPELWKRIKSGYYSVLIVQPEQLGTSHNGHRAQLCQLLSDNRAFISLVQCVHIDEAHTIFTAGIDLYGIAAFRPAWGQLGKLRVIIGKQVPVQALSGTQPPHIRRKIISSLMMDEPWLRSVTLSSNRENLVYATHGIIGQRSDFRNLGFLVPDGYDGSYQLPKGIVFHDDKREVASAAIFIDSRLPKSMRGKGVVQHYHGTMSKLFLECVYNDFGDPNSTCRILHATSGASTGLDIPGIKYVVQYGVTQDIPLLLQRGGHAGRGTRDTAVFLIMYEGWVLKTDIHAVGGDIALDPDHPLADKLGVNASKEDRTGWAMLHVIQSASCLHSLFADYLNDKSIRGMFI